MSVRRREFGGAGSGVSGVSPYTASGSDDSAGILAVFNAMKAAGHATGTLKLAGPIVLNTQLVLDGGFTDVNDSAYSNDTGARFVLDASGASIQPGASVGQAIILKNMYAPEARVNFIGGGQNTVFADAAMTSGSNILSTVSTVMSASWVGRSVVVVGADSQSGYLVSVIDSFTDSHHVVLRRQATATVSSATAQACVVGLHYENLASPVISVRGLLFAGCVLHADSMASNGNPDSTRGVVAATYPDVNVQDCTMAASLTGINAGHTFESFWQNLNGTTATGLIGSHFGFCDDFSIVKYEGGCSASGLSERVNMLWESCGDGNHGAWSLGDRDSDCLIKIVGNQSFNGVGATCNFGSVQKIRTSCFAPQSTTPAFDGIKLIDVASAQIGDLHTFRCNRAVYAIGSNVDIKQHHSMSGDANPVVIEADAFNNAPIVTIGGHWRQHYYQTVLINPVAVAEVDAVTITGTPTGGTFVLAFTWQGVVYTTAAIAFNALATAVASAVQAATGTGGQTLPASAVVGTGGPLPGSAVTLTFQSTMPGSVSGLKATGSLTGGAPALTFTRTTAGVAKSASQASMSAGGNSPGLIQLHGTIDTPNLAGVGGMYAIDQQDAASTTVIIDVEGLTALHRNTLAGSINHAGGADLIRKVAQARLENALVHGVTAGTMATIANPGSGTGAQNNTARTATMYLTLQFSVAAAASNAEIELFIGPTNSFSASNRITDSFVQAPSAGTTLFTQMFCFRVPPYWWWSWTDDLTATFKTCVAVYE